MADLQPDTSMYAAFRAPPPSGVGAMSIGDLIGLAQRAREYNTQGAVSNAIQGATDPNTGIVNYSKVLPAAQAGGAFITPDMAASVSHAQDAQLQTRQNQTNAAIHMLSSVLDLGNGATSDDFARIAPTLAGLGIDPSIITKIQTGAHSGPEFIRNLQLLKSTLGPEPLTQVPGGIGGAPVNVPSGQAAMQARGLPPVGGPGYSPGLGTTGVGNEAPFTQAVNESTDYQRDVLPLTQAIPALERLGARGTYPGASELNNLKTFLIGVGADKTLGIDVNKVQDFTEAKKYLVDWSNRASSGGTNDRLAAAFESNPNMTMQQASAVTVAKTALAVRAMREAQIQEFQKTGLPPNQYPGWASQWNQQQDPRAFGLAMMKPTQIKSMLKGMAPAERERFEHSESVASQYPVIAPPGGWNIPEQ